MLAKQLKLKRRHKRVRAKIVGTSKVPRLCVFRSNQHIYAQLIDDSKGKTLASVNDFELKKGKAKSADKQEMSGKIKLAFEVGKLIAKKAGENKISKVVFDRGGFQYHGRVKAVADGAREGGLKF